MKHVNDPEVTSKPSTPAELVQNMALADFNERYPEPSFSPVVALIAAYEEEGSIGKVINDIPQTSCGFPVTTLVVVDGGDDATEDIVKKHPRYGRDLYCCVFPVNLGHGVALKVGYHLVNQYGAKYVVTLDADGQNDPKEMDTLLEPVVSGEADLVIGSRRLGSDNTVDKVRKAGVVFFGKLISMMAHTKLTDTSNGYRAIRADLLKDITLEQPQYQTAEVVIAAAMHGWRIQDRPVTWHPRASGTTKKGHNVWFGWNYAKVTLYTWIRELRNR